MIRIKDRGFEVEGHLKSYDAGTETLFIYFMDGKTLEIPEPPSAISEAIRQIGLAKLINCEIDLLNKKITLLNGKDDRPRPANGVELFGSRILL